MGLGLTLPCLSVWGVSKKTEMGETRFPIAKMKKTTLVVDHQGGRFWDFASENKSQDYYIMIVFEMQVPILPERWFFSVRHTAPGLWRLPKPEPR